MFAAQNNQLVNLFIYTNLIYSFHPYSHSSDDSVHSNLSFSSHRSTLQRRCHCIYSHVPPPPVQHPPSPQAPPRRGFLIIFRHTTVGRTPLDEESAGRKHLYLTTQHSQETDIHGPGEIRTGNPNKRSAAEPCPTPLGHWDRHLPV